MARYSLIHNVFVASPSDVEEFRKSSFNVINKWNKANPIGKVYLESKGWEDLHPQIAKEGPQKVINKLLNDSDFLIGIFWHRIGSKTKDFISGTVEEIHRFSKMGGSPMIYFCEKKLPSDYSKAQYRELESFKEECKKYNLYATFKNGADLREQINQHLSLCVHESDNSFVISALKNLYKRNLRKGYSGWTGFNFHFKIEENAEFHIATFVPGDRSSSNPEKWWELESTHRINDYQFISKEYVESLLREAYFPLKFFLKVPNEACDHYYSELLNNDVVVTGKGDDYDPDFKRIWFLAMDGHMHPDMSYSYLANHSIVDLSMV